MSGGSMVAPGGKKSLADLMDERGFTNGSLGDLIDTSGDTISSWRQKRTRPRPKPFKRLLQALQVEPHEIDLVPMDYQEREVKRLAAWKAQQQKKEALLSERA